MRHVGQRLEHLPAPASPGREDGRSPASVVHGDQQRPLHAAAFARNKARQYDGTQLRLTRILERADVGQLLPTFHVLRGIFLDARDQAVLTRRCQLDVGAHERVSVLAFGQNGRQNVRVHRLGPPSVRQRVFSAQEQNTASTAVDEFLHQFLLIRREVGRVYAAKDDAVEGEQIFHLAGESVFHLGALAVDLRMSCIAWPAHTLAIKLVGRGAQDGGHVQGLVILDGALEKLELPARLAVQIKDARLARVDVHQPRDAIIASILFVSERLNRRFESLYPSITSVEQNRFPLLGPLGLQGHVLAGDHFGAFLQRNLGFLPGIAVLVKADRRTQARFRQRSRGHIHVADFDVVAHGFAAQPDGVDRNPLAANLRQRFQVDAARIIGAIAQQDHRPDRQVGGIRRHLLQGLADMRGRGSRGQLLQLVDALGMIAHAVHPDLKLLLQRLQQAIVEDFRRGILARAVLIPGGHAGRVVDDNRHNVLLRF